MSDFSSFSTWGLIFVFIAVFGSLLLGNVIKKTIPFMKKSLIPFTFEELMDIMLEQNKKEVL